MQNRILLILGLALVVIFGVLAALIALKPKGPSSKELKEAKLPVTLTYWRVFDGDQAIQDIIAEYQQKHPNVTIQYRRLRFEEYESELVNALAENRGPDIFSIHNTWMGKYEPKIEPVPDTRKIAFFIQTSSGFQKKTDIKLQDIPAPTIRELQEQFIDAVTSDVIRNIDGKTVLVGVPYFVDVLALFYNKDLFNNAGIGAPPRSWTEFTNMVSEGRLTVRDPNTREIKISGAALGGAGSVQRSTDILATLMMQNGAQMSSPTGITFDRIPDYIKDDSVHPSINALMFYTDFASPTSELYTWDEKFSDSFEAFTQGRTAMMFGYSYHLDQLRALNPRIRYGVVPLPQLNPEVPATMANYWVEVVSKRSARKDYAWDFLLFATAKEQAQKYLESTRKPTALRDLIEGQKKADALYPFAAQLLMAKTWFYGKNPDTMERAMASLITEALLGKGGTPEEQKTFFGGLLTKTKQIIQNGY
ncbi:extracellular solute-binding protein [Candidatus Uhrbacteria bacterium]|nr:extracellular solute-binding protein [Candidatus Uhrbacteria bacterium]